MTLSRTQFGIVGVLIACVVIGALLLLLAEFSWTRFIVAHFLLACVVTGVLVFLQGKFSWRRFSIALVLIMCFAAGTYVLMSGKFSWTRFAAALVLMAGVVPGALTFILIRRFSWTRLALALVGALCVWTVAFLVVNARVVGAEWWPFGRHDDRLTVTCMGLTHCCQTIYWFHDETGRYPADLAELVRFVERKRGQYPLEEQLRERLTRDAWGRPLRYVIDRPRFNKGAYDLYSVGRNGRDEYDKEDFGDDILGRTDGSVRPPSHN